MSMALLRRRFPGIGFELVAEFPVSQFPGPMMHAIPMKLVYFLADTFIQTFGITQPTEKARKQAAYFILSLLFLLLGVLAAAAVVLRWFL